MRFHQFLLRARLAPLLTAALLLGACTGTHEPELPTLLIVGVTQGGQAQLALLEKLPLPVAGGPLVQFVDGSRRNLPAPAVALDFTARNLERDSAWVLMRSVGGGGASAYLQRFQVADIDPAAPAAFRATGGSLVTLTEPGGGGLLAPGLTTNLSVCPTAVQSSRDGSWLLVLDVPTVCAANSNDSPVIWLVDPAAPSAKPLQVTNDVLGVAPYTDQAQLEERGYFLVAGTSSAQVYITDQDGVTQPLGLLSLAADPQLLSSAVGSGAALFGLADGQLVGTDLTATGAATFGPVTTEASGRTLVMDPLGISANALVLATNQVAVHGGVRTDAPPDPNLQHDTFSFSAVAGSIFPLSSYGYALGNGALAVIDLYTGQAAADGDLRWTVNALPELQLPLGSDGRPIGVIDWVLAAEPLPAP